MATYPNNWSTEQFSDQLILALQTQAVLLNAGASRIDCQGDRAVHIPRLLTDPLADWAGELQPLPTNNGTTDELVLTPMKLGDVVHLSTESIQDSSVDQLNVVSESLVRGVARKLDATAFSDAAAVSGTNPAPAGLLHATLPGTEADPSVDAIITGIGAVQAAGGNPNVVFINPADLTTLRLAKASGTGQYLLQPDPQQPGATQVAGARMIPTSAIAEGYILICEARYIAVAVGRDMTAETDTSILFDSYGVSCRVTARVDFAWQDTNAAYLISPSA